MGMIDDNKVGRLIETLNRKSGSAPNYRFYLNEFVYNHAMNIFEISKVVEIMKNNNEANSILLSRFLEQFSLNINNFKKVIDNSELVCNDMNLIVKEYNKIFSMSLTLKIISDHILNSKFFLRNKNEMTDSLNQTISNYMEEIKNKDIEDENQKFKDFVSYVKVQYFEAMLNEDI